MIGARCRIIVEPGATIDIGDGCELDDGCVLVAYDKGSLVLGKGVFLGRDCTIAARESVVLGAGTYLAEMVSLRDHDHQAGRPPSAGSMSVDPVVVESDVWIAAKVTILKGAHIGDRSVIGANAVVRGTIPPNSVAVGIPAKVVRRLPD